MNGWKDGKQCALMRRVSKLLAEQNRLLRRAEEASIFTLRNN